MTSSDRLILITNQKTKSMSSTFNMLMSTNRYILSAPERADEFDDVSFRICSFQSLIGQF